MPDETSLDDAVLKVAERATKALEKLIFSLATPEEVFEEITDIDVSGLLENNWAKITSDPKYQYHLEILQTVLTLKDQLLDQVQEMGVDSLKSDLEDLDFAREKLAKM
jgi:hypothetical protein